MDKRSKSANSQDAKLDNLLNKLKREDEALERLLREEPHRYWRLKEVYEGRKFRFMREAGCI